jgi:hypothetical protein
MSRREGDPVPFDLQILILTLSRVFIRDTNYRLGVWFVASSLSAFNRLNCREWPAAEIEDSCGGEDIS